MLMGEAGNDTLTGVGHSLLLGGAGDDVYVVTGLTDIIIEEANSGIDTVQSAASHTLADNVENLTLTGSGSVNGTGNALDNVIVGGTGKNILLGLAGNDSVTFGASSNTVDGGSGNDLIKVASQTYRYQYNSVNTLQGGTGDDRIESGNSADTYLFNRGDGRDTINDNDAYGYGKTDRIVFGNGITQGDLSGYRMGNHLVLRINDATNPTASDQITVEDWYVSTQYQIESLQFADGSSLSAVQLTALCNNVYGTGAADTINGFADNNTIYGLDGDDIITDIGGTNVMYGGAGNDTVTYAIGSSNSVDGGSGNDLIRVASQTYRYQYNSVNTLQGGTGDDRIESGNSADTYLFNRGDGRDTINDYDYYGYGKTDKIAFGAGIGQGDLIGTRVGNNLVLKINDPANTSVTDQITVENWFHLIAIPDRELPVRGRQHAECATSDGAG
ncbi:MAG: calcium-binding protein [Rhodocyclaceae bacterium]|nr:calcium-binding protein [Rhodocyclaceae bacterium]